MAQGKGIGAMRNRHVEGYRAGTEAAHACAVIRRTASDWGVM